MQPVFTRVRHWTLSWDTLIQITPAYTLSVSFILILSSCLRPGLQNNLLHISRSKLSLKFFIFTISATCPTHLILLDLITLVKFGEEHILWSSSLSSFLPFTLTSSLRIQILFLTHCSQTPSDYFLLWGEKAIFTEILYYFYLHVLSWKKVKHFEWILANNCRINLKCNLFS